MAGSRPSSKMRSTCSLIPATRQRYRRWLRFGFIARHIRAFRQDARPCPVLPNKERSHGDISGSHQIGMERIVTVLTDKQESLLGAIGITGMPAHRAGEATVVGVYLDRHTAMQERFIGKHAMQLGKGPFRMHCIGFALLPTY